MSIKLTTPHCDSTQPTFWAISTIALYVNLGKRIQLYSRNIIIIIEMID